MCVGPEIMMAMQVGGFAAAGSGAFGQFFAGKRQSEASKEAAMAEMRGKELQAARQKREIIRSAQQASAVGLVNVTNQTGSSAAGSSALPGAQAQISGQAREQSSNIDQQMQISRDIFKANIKSIEAGQDAAMWKGFSQIGTAMMGGAKPASEMLDSFFNGSTTNYRGTYRGSGQDPFSEEGQFIGGFY